MERLQCTPGLWGIAPSTLVLRLASTTATTAASSAFPREGVVAAGLEVCNLPGLAVVGEFEPCLLGVSWHAFQFGVSFAWLIRITAEDIETD